MCDIDAWRAEARRYEDERNAAVGERDADKAEIRRLRELAATATRAHTRACWAIKGEVEYPEEERQQMGAYLTQELQA